jgi:peptide/nickel transport system substrate-binding protein
LHFAVKFKWNQHLSLVGPLKDVIVVDEYTVKFVMETQFAPFINSLAHKGFSMLSPTAVKKYGDNFGRSPVGTGPYKLIEWQDQQRILLGKNENYWQEGICNPLY